MGLAQEVRALYLAGVGGTGIVTTIYPTAAAGTALTASGKTTGAYKFAAAGANVKAVVAKAVITTNYRVVGAALDTLSATSIFILRVGRGAAGGAAMTAVAWEAKLQQVSAAGPVSPFTVHFAPTVVADAATDGVLADLASSNAGADDTAVIHLQVTTGIGT